MKRAFGMIWILLLAVVLIMVACNCESKEDENDDTNDDADDDTDDDTDDDDTDDDAEGWYIYTIDSEDIVGKYPSIAIDSRDKVHISYYDYGWYESHLDLKYATNKSGSWERFTIDSEGNTGRNPSIVIDTSDKIHICYFGPGGLRYATNKSGTWQTSVIDNDGDRYCSIALDSNDKVHISYQICDWDDEFDECLVGDLEYATNKSGTWQAQTVDASDDTGWHTDIEVDSNGKVHISYYNSSEGNYMYATNKSGSWVKEDTWLPGPPFPEEADNSLALDSGGSAHISFYYFDGLGYATNKDGSFWDSFTTIDPEPKGENAGLFNSITLDSKGKIHISYYGEPSEDLKYATNKSGTWQITTVDSNGKVGLYTSIAVDSEDYVHISYYDGTNQDLKYATNRPPE